MCNNAITVLPATHTHTIPAFTPLLQGVAALWVLLIMSIHEGIARLIWVAGYIPTCPTSGTEPGYVTHLGTNRAQRTLTSLIETIRATCVFLFYVFLHT